MHRCCKSELQSLSYKGFTINPPKQAYYSLSPLPLTFDMRRTISNIHGSRFKEMEFSPIVCSVKYPWIEEHCYLYKKSLRKNSKKNEKLVILHLISRQNENGLTILLSHGDECTLGHIYPMMIDLCSELKCHIVSYDYSGFGLSEGKSSESNMYSDIEEVGMFVKDCLMIKIKDLVLFGYSIGAAPTVHFCNNETDSHVAGVVLLSPYLLGSEATKKHVEKKDYDFLGGFLNTDCPYFLIHGKKDTIIPYTLTDELSNQLRNVYVWYPKKGDHVNIMTECRNKFYSKLKFFITYVAKERLNRSELLDEFTVRCNAINNPKKIKSINLIDNYINDNCNLGKTPIRQSQLTFVSDNSSTIRQVKTIQSTLSYGQRFSLRRSKGWSLKFGEDSSKTSSSKRVSEFNLEDNNENDINSMNFRISKKSSDGAIEKKDDPNGLIINLK